MRILTFILLFLPLITFSQGLIINEISNGDAGNKEYFELVAIGSSTNPTGNIDFGGWIIDDNNGDFKGALSGVGTARGHIRIKSGCLSSVKPGSIILIYNSVELSLGSDPLDSNGDCVYIFAISDLCLDNTTDLPITTNPTYTPVSYISLRTWAQIGLRNDGDVAQVRKPNGTFFHGFSYGDVSAPFPTFPFGGSSFNVMTTSGFQKNYFFNCGSFAQSTNFSRGTSPLNETPGLPNNDANRYFINSLRTGTYDYTNLTNSLNCGSSTTLVACDFILDVDLLKFESQKNTNSIDLSWTILNTDVIESVTIQRSFDGFSFEDLIILTSDENFYQDFNYNQDNYYRLYFIEKNGLTSYSRVLQQSFDEEGFSIFPNPSSGKLFIKNNRGFEPIKIYDCYGRYLFEVNSNLNSLDLELPNGFYYLQIENSFYKFQIFK